MHRLMVEHTGHPLMSDRHGLMTYPTDPQPLIVGGHASGTTTHPWPFREAFQAATEYAPLTEQERLAFDLFSAAAFCR